MNRFIELTSILFTSITLSGCATTIITKAEMSDAKIDSIKCEPIALTVYRRYQFPPADDTSILVSYSPDAALRDKVIDERKKGGCNESVEIRDIKSDRIDFKVETFPMDLNPAMNIVPPSQQPPEIAPRKTADSLFAEYMNTTYPKNGKKWIQVGFRHYAGPHGPEPLAYIFHFVSLGLIPVPDNENYDLEVRVLTPHRNPEFQQITFDTKIWSWLPFVFRSDSRFVFDMEKELRLMPVRRVFEGMAE